jgi:hypothetical protein
VLSQNYNYGSIVLVVNDVVNVMAAYQPVCKRAVHGRGSACGLIIVCISWNNKKWFDTDDARCKHEEKK